MTGVQTCALPISTTTNAIISIVNQNVGGGGNDFALDDIFFSELKVCTDSVSVFIENPVMNLGLDTTVCEGQYVFIQPTETYNNYYWSTGATTPSIMVVAAGPYWCQGTNSSNCIAIDTINVLFKPQPRLELSVVKNPICEGETATIIVESSTAPIFLIWNNGMLGDTIRVKPNQNTLFTVFGNASDCLDTADIEIEVVPHQTIFLGDDDFLCTGEERIFNLDSLNGTFLWSTDENTSAITVTEPGF